MLFAAFDNYVSIIWNIVSPIFAFLILFGIISAIWCYIFKISYITYFNNVIKPVILLFYSFAYLIFIIAQLPVTIYEYIKLFLIELAEVFSFVINFFNSIANVLYEFNEEIYNIV